MEQSSQQSSQENESPIQIHTIGLLRGSPVHWRGAARDLLVFSLIGLLAACGQPGSRNSQVPVAALTPQEKIEAVIRDSFGGTYNPLDPENLKLAGRIEGASAFVDASALLLEDKVGRTDGASGSSKDDVLQVGVAKSDGSAGGGATTATQEAAIPVRVKVLLTGQQAEISAAGVLAPIQRPMPLTNDPGSPENFRIEARCDNARCSRVIALLIEKDLSQQQAVGSKGAAASSRASSSSDQAVYRQAAIIFRRPKSESASGSQPRAQAKSEGGAAKSDARSSRMDKAAGEKAAQSRDGKSPAAKGTGRANDPSNTSNADKNLAKAISEEERALITGDEPLPIFWCAPGPGQPFEGGTKLSVHAAQLIRVEKRKAEARSGAMQPQLPGPESSGIRSPEEQSAHDPFRI